MAESWDRITYRSTGRRYWGAYVTPYKFNIIINEFVDCKAHQDKYPTRAAVTCESSLASDGYYRISLTKYYGA